MKLRKFNLSIVLLLVVALVVTACGEGNNSGKTNKPQVENLPAALVEKGDIKIKVIRKIGGDDHTAQFLAGAKQEGESLGFKVDVFSANGDTLKFHEALEQAANEDIDAVIISHGEEETTVEEVQALRNKGIEVVAFDSIEGLTAIEGVTSTSQNDESLATFALDHLVAETGGEAKILYLWVDGFSAMVRRNAVYQDVLAANPGIVELDRFGIANDNPSVNTQEAVATLLSKYPKGELDAIFATWDAFAIGAHRALVEAGRTEVKIFGIDVSNPDLEAIQEENSPWVSTAAVDPKLIGAITVRLAAKKLAGEETPATYSLDANIIKQSDLKAAAEPVKMDTLGDIIPG
ncbi:MAG TPA: sugar ABC transporter substrate-binding protein, partial [Candidatus Paenibacillus intestinavium]|nr:sugar ABC transporter substrate-binding protein [Candidatus Paenibacillus intestinavium]